MCNKSRVFLSLIVFLFINLSFSQKIKAQKRVSPDFKRLECLGPMPAVLNESMEDIINRSKEYGRNRDDSHKTERNKMDFYKQSAFNLDLVLHSGRVSYGDEITTYLNAIKDTLLFDYPMLKEQITILTLRSPYVNAFATNTGMIFFNTGLLAQVEDEAQLAFIIAHEIVHFVKQHALNMHVEGLDYETDGDVSSSYREVYKYHLRSKEVELEADELGLKKYYLDVPYDLESVESVFDVLLFSYLPFHELRFDFSMFESEHYRLNPEYFPAEIQAISAIEDYNDDLSTHPNIKTRKEKMLDILVDADQSIKRKKFLISEETFYYVRDLARFESIRQSVIEGEYVRAIYNAFVVQQVYPDHPFLKEVIGYCLYAVYNVRSPQYNGDLNLTRLSDVEGEMYELVYFLREIDRGELLAIALSYNWKLHKEYQDNLYQKQIVKKLALATSIESKFKFEDYSFTPVEQMNAVSDSLNLVDSLEAMTKYEKIRHEKMLRQNDTSQKIMVFTEIESVDELHAMLKTYRSKSSEYYEEVYSYESEINVHKPVNSVIIRDPKYFALDMRDGAEFNYNRMMRRGDRIKDNLLEVVPMVYDEFLFLSEIDSADLEFNAIQMEWLVNEFLTEAVTISDDSTILFTSRNLHAVAEATSIRHICIPTVIYYKERKFAEVDPALYFYSILLYPLAPAWLVWLPLPTRNNFTVLTTMVDLETGLVVHNGSAFIDVSESPDFLKQRFYEILVEYKTGMISY